MSRKILCFGEVLWDSLPEGLFPGGAPFNVACHIHAMGGDAAIVSRVGRDVLGDEILSRLRRRGVSIDLMAEDDSLPTGFVRVHLDAFGNAAYEIVAPSAWDAIGYSDKLDHEAAGAWAIVYGSLAQRDPRSRASLGRLLQSPARKVFDVNLRPPFDGSDVVLASLEAADIVKLNSDELLRIASWFGLPHAEEAGVAALAHQFSLQMVSLTRGDKGAALWHGGHWEEVDALQVTVADTVGAGDAFLAALLVSMQQGCDDRTMLERANRAGAFVASRRGAIPEYTAVDMRAFFSR
jgi:fructokinase